MMRMIIGDINLRAKRSEKKPEDSYITDALLASRSFFLTFFFTLMAFIYLPYLHGDSVFCIFFISFTYFMVMVLAAIYLCFYSSSGLCLGLNT